MIYVVSSYNRSAGLVNLHAFSDYGKATSFALDYLYNRATREDLESKIQEAEWDGFIEYSLYTTKYGELTVRVADLPLD